MQCSFCPYIYVYAVLPRMKGHRKAFGKIEDSSHLAGTTNEKGCIFNKVKKKLKGVVSGEIETAALLSVIQFQQLTEILTNFIKGTAKKELQNQIYLFNQETEGPQ